MFLALDDKASNLATLSQKYKKDAHYLNLKSSYFKIAAIVVVFVVILLFIRYWFFWCLTFKPLTLLTCLTASADLWAAEFYVISLLHARQRVDADLFSFSPSEQIPNRRNYQQKEILSQWNPATCLTLTPNLITWEWLEATKFVRWARIRQNIFCLVE